jgi:hypothetical protein
MAQRTNLLGKIVVATVAPEPPSARADAIGEITAFHADLSSYVLASVDLRLRRDGSEFPHGRVLNREEAELIVEAVRDFFNRYIETTPVPREAR